MNAPSPPPRGGRLMVAIRSPAFLAGFFGWFLVQAAAWLIATGGRPEISVSGDAGLGLLLIFTANILVLLALALIKRTRRVAGGMLAALGVNFLLALLRGMLWESICFVPFFVTSW